MSRSLRFILIGSVWTLTSVLFAAGLQTPGGVLMDTGWVLASVVFLSTCLALASAIVQSPLLRSSAFISHLLTPLTWAMWVSALDQTAFSFSIWSLVSLVALVGAVLVEHGLELDFQLVSAGETALKDDLRKAATPVFCGASALETGSLQAPTL